MKKITAVLLLAVAFTASSFAQEANVNTATFSYDKATLKTAVQSKTVKFSVAHLKDDAQANEFKAQADKYYSKFFTLSVGQKNDKGAREVTVQLTDPSNFMYLSRFFAVTNISQVNFNGGNIASNTFFMENK